MTDAQQRAAAKIFAKTGKIGDMKRRQPDILGGIIDNSIWCYGYFPVYFF